LNISIQTFFEPFLHTDQRPKTKTFTPTTLLVILL
jgi:hypothetical protein